MKSLSETHPTYWNALDEVEKTWWLNVNVERTKSLIQSCTVDKAKHEAICESIKNVWAKTAHEEFFKGEDRALRRVRETINWRISIYEDRNDTGSAYVLKELLKELGLDEEGAK